MMFVQCLGILKLVFYVQIVRRIRSIHRYVTAHVTVRTARLSATLCLVCVKITSAPGGGGLHPTARTVSISFFSVILPVKKNHIICP